MSEFSANDSVPMKKEDPVPGMIAPSPSIPIVQKTTIVTSLSRNEHSNKTNLYLSRSPTDLLMSPCSRKIWGSKRVRSPDLHLTNKPFHGFDIKDHVSPVEYPGGNMKFIFGTSSKSRKCVVEALGWDYVQMSPDIDGKLLFSSLVVYVLAHLITLSWIIEKAIRSEDPMIMPLLIAEAKAKELFRRLMAEENQPEECLIFTADQIVLFEDTVREKPTSREEAVQFLSSYSNSSVSTIAAIVITHFPTGVQSSSVDVATVHWYSLSEEVVNKVVNKGSIFSSAGGFEIEDADLNPLIASIDGTVDSVLGLPVTAMLSLIHDVLTTLKK